MKEKWISSVMAGVYIALGAMVYLSVPNAMIGSLFFAAGIFLVVNFHNMLFTRVCPLSSCTCKYRVTDLLTAWCGNGIGAAIVAVAGHYCRLEGKISEKLQGVGELKLGDSPASLFIMGVFCAMFVSFSVLLGSKYEKGSFGQIFFIWLFITAFVYAGLEHIVANMYYMTAYSLAFGVDAAGLLKIAVWVTAGNVAGGLFTGYIEKKYIS